MYPESSFSNDCSHAAGCLVAVVVFLGLAGAVVAAVVWLVREGMGSPRCDSCKRLFCRVTRKRTLLRERVGYKVIHGGGSVYGSGPNHSQVSGSFSIPTQIKVLRKWWRLELECRYCGFQWLDTELTEDRDFDLPEGEH